MAESLAKSEARRSEFVANVSHELKTPMTTIAGFADGILDGTIPPERQEDALRTISAGDPAVVPAGAADAGFVPPAVDGHHHRPGAL